MGWCSGTEIFDDMCDVILTSWLTAEHKDILLKRLINSLENLDWDCQSDSEYYNNPRVQIIFKELHPDWFEDDVDDLETQLKNVTDERNTLAIMLNDVLSKEIRYLNTSQREFIIMFSEGYYK